MRRALLMASGANHGAYYAGFLEPLQQAGIEFELMAGVSAGGIASAWFAAGDPEALVDSWRQADRWRVAPHPWASVGRWTMEWARIRLAIALGEHDMQAAIAAYRRGASPVVVGSVAAAAGVRRIA